MKLLLPASAAVVIALAALSSSALAQESARVTTKATEVERNGEDYIQVDVSVEDVEDLGGFEFVMSWNQEQLTLDVDDQTAIQRGEFLGSSGREVLCESPVLEAFALRYACVTLGMEPREGAAGDGLLATVFLRPTGNGDAAIQFTLAQLSTPPGEVIPSEWEQGEVSVTSDDSSIPWMAVGIGGAAALAVVGVIGAVVYMRRRPGEAITA